LADAREVGRPRRLVGGRARLLTVHDVAALALAGLRVDGEAVGRAVPPLVVFLHALSLAREHGAVGLLLYPAREADVGARGVVEDAVEDREREVLARAEGIERLRHLLRDLGPRLEARGLGLHRVADPLEERQRLLDAAVLVDRGEIARELLG